MIWLRMFWWMVWRAVLSGAVCGALFGTFMGMVRGAVIGFVYGALLGLIIGLVNGLALTIMTRIWFSSPQDLLRFRKASITLVVVCTTITSFVILNGLFFGISLLVYVPTFIAAFDLGVIVRRFPDYATHQFWLRGYPSKRSSRQAQIAR
jgi:hypothetical protein